MSDDEKPLKSDIIFDSHVLPHIAVPCLHCGETKKSAVMIRNMPALDTPFNLCAQCLGLALVGGLAMFAKETNRG